MEILQGLAVFLAGCSYAVAVLRMDSRDSLRAWARPQTKRFLVGQALLGLPASLVVAALVHPIAGVVALKGLIIGSWYGVGVLRGMRRAAPSASCACPSCPANGA